jgi:hypothetical protein
MGFLKNLFKNMIQINSSTYSGRSIVIKNNRVIIDGVDVTSDHKDSKEISITVTGDLGSLDVEYANSIQINGSVGKLDSGSGDVNCGNVTGGVRTGSGDVECGSIEGDVQTGSGDVEATTITGSVKTGSGDIKYKK